MFEQFSGRDCLITGAAGFIGSAVAAKLRYSGLRSLVCLDASERNLFDLARMLGDGCKYVLGDAGDCCLATEALAGLREPIVIHAAAYKHVELLETQLVAAVRNNTLASCWLAQCALEAGASQFVLVSTDKAVRPRSVMGATKRAAERLVLSLGERVNAVRLGNVLGSTGSVVPLFAEQSKRGEALTVSDLNAARYFFSSDTAVGAVCQAAMSGVSARVLLPPFGEPTTLRELICKNFPNSPVRELGLRAGEKLREEFIAPEEEAVGEVDGLRIVTTPLPSADEMRRIISEMSEGVARRDRGALLRLLGKIVPDYVPSRAVVAHAGVSL